MSNSHLKVLYDTAAQMCTLTAVYTLFIMYSSVDIPVVCYYNYLFKSVNRSIFKQFQPLVYTFPCKYMILWVYNRGNKLIGYSTEIRSFGDVLPDETVHILIGSTFPRMVRLTKIERNFHFLRYFLMFCKCRSFWNIALCGGFLEIFKFGGGFLYFWWTVCALMPNLG